jgi:hypothetical protein
MDDSRYHVGSKAMSKIKKNHISRMPHPPYLPESARATLALWDVKADPERTGVFFE